MKLSSKRLLSTIMAAALVTANLVDGGSIGRAFASVTTETGAEVHQDANADRSAADVDARDSGASMEQNSEADIAEGQNPDVNTQGAETDTTVVAEAQNSSASQSGDTDTAGKEAASIADEAGAQPGKDDTSGASAQGGETNTSSEGGLGSEASGIGNNTAEGTTASPAESETRVSEETGASAGEATKAATLQETTDESPISQETVASETTVSGTTASGTAVPETSVSETTVPETTLPETTAAAYKEIHVTFHVVDDLGNEISEKYDDVKVHFDSDGVLTLDQEDQAPVRSIRRQTGSMLAGLIKFYSKKYSYRQATIDGEVIRAIRKRDEDGVTVYEYTTDGENWTALNEDTEVLLVYARPESDAKLYAEYLEEGKIKVTVELQKELPDGVELKVQELTPEEDNYDAYMTALAESARKSASELATYSEDNTLLYDISFIGTDEDGKPYEYQPDGDVSVKVEFLGGQLSQELGAAKAGDVEIRHLPVKEEVKARAAEDGERVTADLTDLTADDILVETVKDANVTIDKTAAKTGEEDEAEERKDTATFSVGSFCIFSFKNGSQTDGTYWEGHKTISVDSLIDKLGLASRVAVYTHTLENHQDHLEGSIAVNTFIDDKNNHLNQAQRLIDHNDIESITIQKKVDQVSDESRTFSVGLYSEESAEKLLQKVSLTVEKGENTASQVITRSDSSYSSIFEQLQKGPIYIYELDDQCNPVKEQKDKQGNVLKPVYKDINGEEKYQVTYTNSGSGENESPNKIIDGKDIFGNYIGQIDRSNDTLVEPNYFGERGFKTYLGSDHIDDKFSGQNNMNLDIYHSDGSSSITLKDYKNYSPDDPSQYIKNLTPEKFEEKTGLNKNLGENGEFAKESILLADAKRGVTESPANFNVINLVGHDAGEDDYPKRKTGNGNLDNDLKRYAGFTDNDAIKHLLSDKSEEYDEYLLINIDASNLTSYTLTQLFIDGENADSLDAYPRIGSHIIYNFVQRDDKGNFEPYTGEVNINNVAAGLIFAPAATVNQTGGLRGGIIANTVIRPQSAPEIHQKLIGSIRHRYITFLIDNSENPKVNFKVSKNLQGISWDNDKVKGFDFELRALDKAPLPKGAKDGKDGKVVTVHVSKDAQSADFGDIVYDREGEYKYQIIEVIPDAEHKIEGLTYAEPQTVVVDIKNENGKLKAKISGSSDKLVVSGDQVTANFVNIYTASQTEITLKAKKILTGRAIRDGEFTLTLTGDTPEKQSVTNQGEKIEFSPITYHLSDLNGQTSREFHYQIAENKGNLPGITYDEHKENVTVTVKVNGEGKLTAVAKYDDGKEYAQFTNRYKKTMITVQKSWDDNENARKTRPSEVTVHLQKNGESKTIDTQVLNESNDWKHTWDNLAYTDKSNGYTVVEDPVSEYSLSKEVSERELEIGRVIEVKLINHYKPTAPETTSPTTAPETTSPTTAPETTSPTTAPETTSPTTAPETTSPTTVPETSPTVPETSPTTPETSPTVPESSPTTPETSPVETTPTETTRPSHDHHDHSDKPTPSPTTTAPETTTAVETTTVAETTTEAGTTALGHEHSEDITGPDGSVMGAGRNRNRKAGTTDDSGVAGANRQVKTGDISMIRLYAVGAIAAIALLIGWFISWKKKQR